MSPTAGAGGFADPKGRDSFTEIVAAILRNPIRLATGVLGAVLLGLSAFIFIEQLGQGWLVVSTVVPFTLASGLAAAHLAMNWDEAGL